MKEKIKKVGYGASVLALTLPISAFASENTASGVIKTAGESLKTESLAVIAAALGLAVVVFGAKRLWGVFKSMSK